MPWLLALSGYHQPWHYLCRLIRLWLSWRAVSSTGTIPNTFVDIFIFPKINSAWHCLTHWGRVTHKCVGKLTIIASDNGLSPGRRQAIIWTNAGILLIGPLRTKFNEILIKIHAFSFMKMHLKMSSAKWRPFCLGPNVLNSGQANTDQNFRNICTTLNFWQLPWHV